VVFNSLVLSQTVDPVCNYRCCRRRHCWWRRRRWRWWWLWWWFERYAL